MMSTPAPHTAQNIRRIRLSLFYKILLASFVAGLLPLLIIAYRSVVAIMETGNTAQSVAARELDQKSIDSLQVRAAQTAERISALLNQSVQDTLYISRVAPDQQVYLSYYFSRQGTLWYESGTPQSSTTVYRPTPLYREIAYIDATGQEVIRIRDGNLVSGADLRNVSDPANTTYLTETYFAEASRLSRNQVWVSPVMAWFATNPAQPAQAVDAGTSRFEYAKYEAVVRFAAPVRDSAGRLEGVVVLSLDFRHVMEMVNHIQSITGEVVWPDVASGNYAYMLDYTGWLVAHPDLTTLRGLDENGNLMPSRMAATTDEEMPLPLNMLLSDFGQSKPDTPTRANNISSRVLNGESGYLEGKNRQGAFKVDIYVPIEFDYGVYARGGYFGGIVLSEAVQNVEAAGKISSEVIASEVKKVLWDVAWIVGLGLLFLFITTVLVSRNITEPVSLLTEAARTMEKGEVDMDLLERVTQRRVEDEVTELTLVFKQMAQAVQMREKRLREEVQMLRIQIDESKKKEEVDKIVQSEVFKNLQEKAALMRARRQTRTSGPTE